MLIKKNRGSTYRFANRKSTSDTSSPVRVWGSWILVEIGFLLAVIALFNLFPQLIGIDRSPDAVSDPMPFIAPGFTESLPWLNLWWILALAVNASILIFKVDTRARNMARLGVNLLGLVILIRLVVAGPLISLNPVWLSSVSSEASSMGRIASDLESVLSLGITISISIAILALFTTSIGKIQNLDLRPLRRVSRKAFSLLPF